MSMGSSGLFLAPGGAVSLDGSFGSSMGWTPLALGPSLLAWWDASRADLITAPAGVTTSWRDVAFGRDQTAATTACPTYSLTSFNGAPGFTFDGVANCLAMLGAQAWLPSGAAGSEDWYLFDETAPAADTGTRFLGAWGSGSSTARRAGGVGETTAYHTRTNTGDGGAGPANTGTIEMFGRHVLRYVVEPTQTWAEVDGVAQTATAVVPATTTTNLRTGASANATAANFAKGVMACRIITSPLTAAQADRLRAWMMRRR